MGIIGVGGWINGIINIQDPRGGNIVGGYMLNEWKNQTKYTILWVAWCLRTLELMLYINTI